MGKCKGARCLTDNTGNVIIRLNYSFLHKSEGVEPSDKNKTGDENYEKICIWCGYWRNNL